MADVSPVQRFNPFLDKFSGTDYTSASKGTKSQEYAPTEYAKHDVVSADQQTALYRKEKNAPTNHATYVQPEIVDKSKGILIAGLGDATAKAIDLGDNIFKEKIKNDLTEQADQIRDDFNATAAKALVGDTPDPIPSPLKKLADSASSLKDQHEAGYLRDSNYWARLDLISKQMRDRYPMYGDYIDQTLARITGSVPANALRRSLIDDLTSADSPAQQLQRLEKQAITDGNLPADYYIRKAKGNPYNYDELGNYIAQRTRDIKDLEVRKANKEADLQYNSDTATKEIWMKTNDVFTASSGAFAKNYKEFNDLYQKDLATQKTRPLTSDEENQLRTSWAPLRQQYIDNATNTVKEYLANGKIDTATADKIMTNVTNFVNLQESGLTNQNFGILLSTKAWIEATQNSDKATILQSNDMFRKMAAVKDLVGDTGLSWLLTSGDTEFQNAATKATKDLVTLNMVTGGSKYTMAQAIDKGIADKQPPEFFTALVKSNQDSIMNTDLPAEARANLAMSSFTGDWWARIPMSKRGEIWSSYTSPQFVKAMEQLKNEGQVDAYNAYQFWAAHSFQTLLTRQATDAQNIVLGKSGANIGLQWNPTLSAFEITGTPGPGGGLAQAGTVLKSAAGLANPVTAAESFSEAWTKGFVQPAAVQSVNEINKAILGISNVIKAGGGDPQVELPRMLQTMGIDFNAPRENSTLWGQMVNTWKNNIALTPSDATGGQAKKLQDFVGSLEAPGGYSTTIGEGVYNRGTPAQETLLERLPMSDVLKTQSGLLKNGAPSTAVGRYQFTRPTLFRLMNKLNIPQTAQFTPELQDRMFMELANERGLGDFLSGKITIKEFAKNLSQEWAALPDPGTGQSSYEGVGPNHALTSAQTFVDFLGALRG